MTDKKTLHLVDVPPPTPDGNTWLWEGREPEERRRQHRLVGWLETAVLCAVGVFIGVMLALGAVAILRPFPAQHEPLPVARSVETTTEVIVPTRQVENRSIPVSPNVLADMHRWATTLPAASPPHRVIERSIAHRIAPVRTVRQVAIPEAPRGYIGCPASLGATCARLSFTEETRE